MVRATACILVLVRSSVTQINAKYYLHLFNKAASPAEFIECGNINMWIQTDRGHCAKNGRWRVRFPIGSLGFFIDIIFATAIWLCGRLSL